MGGEAKDASDGGRGWRQVRSRIAREDAVGFPVRAGHDGVCTVSRPHFFFSFVTNVAKLFYSQNTDVPVPEVYAFNADAENPIGSPFSLIEYIHGSTADELARSHPGDDEGIPKKYAEKFWRQIAKIMIQLASTRLPEIGSIVRDGSGPFVAGQLVETGTGPYSSSTEFYAEYPLALSKSLGEQPVDGQNELLEAFRSLAASFPAPTVTPGERSAKSFGLANFDLNPNNILVDKDFNIIAVIDWDSVLSVPDAVLYRMLFLMGIACAVPGLVEENPKVLKRVQLGRQFAEVVEQVSREMGRAEHGASKTRPTHILTKSGFLPKIQSPFAPWFMSK